MSSENGERLHRLVGDAEHESVTVELLSERKQGIGRPRLNDRPPISYLRAGEQPHYCFVSGESPSCYGAPVDITRSRRYKVVHLVTDQRWLIISGNRNGDERRSIPLEDITALNYDTGGRMPNRLSDNLVVLDTSNAYYQIPLPRSISTDDVEKLVKFLERRAAAEVGGVELDPDTAGYTVEGVDSYQPTEETVAQLLDEVPDDPEAQKKANEVVKQAETGTELVTELNQLIEDYGGSEPGELLDERVEQAESVEELYKDVESSREEALRELEEKIEEAKEIIREADTEEVGNWGIQTTQAALPLIKASRRSTPQLLALSFLASGAVGAYASGKEDSALSSVDPGELREHALALAGAGEELEEVDGEAIGALLGGSSYLVQSMTPREYAHWVKQADPAAVLEGAEMGAKMTQDLEAGTRNQGMAAGAALGLLHSYTTDTAGGTEIRETLDGDLYKQYLEDLSANDLELPD